MENADIESATHVPGHAAYAAAHAPKPSERDPELDALVREIIERIADKWTMLVLEALEEHGKLRFMQLGQRIGGVSQKMLTKTVRQMEADGLVVRTVHPVIPPRVDYELTEMGRSLGAAFCGVWIWAEQHRKAIADARGAFARLHAPEAK
ncbi:helix-turn-helix domain-containing protein [Robbsia sp. KACC 23696]|uniref:winged helix-turn-helix transcriptional regulator n=1 Tax=Robbsia sp. KACC 23696 TaxID=3149231 RepID=UPI00325B9D9C